MLAMSQLALGTVQFGLDYGINNKQGQVPTDQAKAILQRAIEQDGIKIIDTASAYGEAEAFLGQALPSRVKLQIVTKLAPLIADTSASINNTIRNQFAASLVKLCCESIYALMAHRAADLLGPHGSAVWQVMNEFKAQGLVAKIGASVYDQNEINELLARYPIDIIQLPINVLDQRLWRSGCLQTLTAANVEIHARSIFLQGLLLQPTQIPEKLAALRPVMHHYADFLSSKKMTPAQACFSFIRSIPQVTAAVVGVQTLSEWNELVCAWHQAPTQIDWPQWQVEDEKLLDPRTWPK